MKTETINKIKEHWENQADRYGTHSLATSSPDTISDALEVEGIVKYLLPNKHILDVGCGNGAITMRVAQRVKSNFVGCDYSEKMIEKANDALKKEKSLAKHLEFVVGDALQLPFEDKTFDIVFTNRCLINLPKLKYQLAAVRELHRVLKKGGLYIMSENSTTGLGNLNQLRKAVGLPDIVSPWHNLYIDEKKFFYAVKKLFAEKIVDNFCSSYFFGSRIFNGKLAAMEGKDPDYDAPINHIAAKLPPIGDFSPQKIFVLKKI